MANWSSLFLLVALFYSGNLPGQLPVELAFHHTRITAAGLHLSPLQVSAGSNFSATASSKPFVGTHFLTKNPVVPLSSSSPAVVGNLLPKWTPASLPFFCRVEHDCAKKLPFAFKFRLGSVEYVDRLEGKSIWLGE